MKYTNAKNILPDELILEIQRYVQGEYIYIPALKAKGWGEISGYRYELDERNRSIFSEHESGAAVSALAEKYSLSESAVRKIIRKKLMAD